MKRVSAPAEAGVQGQRNAAFSSAWAPAFAGVHTARSCA
jgi:hypothetical protein